jgi:hypothetical protein
LLASDLGSHPNGENINIEFSYNLGKDLKIDLEAAKKKSKEKQ